MSAWIYLGLAAAFEVLFAVSMKFSEGFTKPLPAALTVTGAVGGFIFLTIAMKTLPVSVAYPIWTAVGILGTVALGFWLLGESLTPFKLISVGFIIAGIVGLRASL